MSTFEIVIATAMLVAFTEAFCALVVFRLRFGHSYYELRHAHFVYEFDRVTAYRLRRNLRLSHPTAPLPTAPRKVLFGDVRTDRYGFLFDGDLRSEQARTIFCIGGSTTAALECRYTESYPVQLDARLPGFRCVNAGVGGYRSIHERLAFNARVRPLKPWGIVIFSGYNDFEDYACGMSAPQDAFKHCLSHHLAGGPAENLLRASALYYLGRAALFRAIKPIRTESPTTRMMAGLEDALAHPVWLDEWRENIGALIRDCRRDGIRCFVLSHVSPVFVGATAEAKAFADTDLNMAGRFDIFVRYVNRINVEAERLCRESGAIYLDVGPAFDRSLAQESDDAVPLYRRRFAQFVDRQHFSAAGNQRLAASVLTVLEEHLT